MEDKKKESPTRSRTIIVNVLLLVLGLGVAYGLYAGLEFGYSTDAPLRVVISDSMYPKYKINDVVVVKGVGTQIIPLLYVFDFFVQGASVSSLKVGDDIIFLCVYPRCTYGVSDPIVHEIIQITPSSSACGGDIQFTTHGIHNPNGLNETPCASDVIGVVTGTVPYIGYVSEFLKSTLGIALIIVLIGILLAIEILEPEKDETKSE